MATENVKFMNISKLRPQLSKIPGGGSSDMPIAKKDEYIKDVQKLTRLELLDTKQRIMKLLLKKKSLPLHDGGVRIQNLYDKIVNELERRASVDEAAKLFSKLNLVSEGEKILNRMEWQGKLPADNQDDDEDPIADVLDSDDENNMDPLRIIAQKQMHQRRIKILPAEPKLITEEDLKEIESFKNGSIKSDENSNGAASSGSTGSTNSTEINAEIISVDIKDKLAKIKPQLHSLRSMDPTNSTNCDKADKNCNHLNQIDFEPHVNYLIEKTEQQLSAEGKEKFKPYQTTVSNVHDPKKERLRKKGKKWEVTAATPPPIQHNSAQLLTLKESVEIQTQYLLNLKELQEKQAAERLAAKLQCSSKYKITLPDAEIAKTHPSYTIYRNPKLPAIDTNHIEGLQGHKEYDEVHDPLDVENSASVIYPVFE